MADSVVHKSEAALAAEQNKNLQRSLIARRTRYIACALFLIALSAVVAGVGLWMVAFCAFVLGLICLLQYFDANGHLHEVRRRSTRTLAPDFSVFRRPDRDSAANPRPASQ